MKIALKVTPGARRNELLGWEEQYPGIGRVLKLKIAAPPIDGRANKAIELYLAELLRIAQKSLKEPHFIGQAFECPCGFASLIQDFFAAVGEIDVAVVEPGIFQMQDASFSLKIFVWQFRGNSQGRAAAKDSHA